MQRLKINAPGYFGWLNLSGEALEPSDLAVELGGSACLATQSSEVPELFIIGPLEVSSESVQVLRVRVDDALPFVTRVNFVGNVDDAYTAGMPGVIAVDALDDESRTVQVYDTAGDAVLDEPVEMEYDDGVHSATVTLPTTPGNYFAVVRVDGELSSVTTLTVGAGAGLVSCLFVLARVDGAETTVMPDATLLISDTDMRPVQQLTTDEDGTASTRLRVGSYVATYAKDGIVFSKNNVAFAVTEDSESSSYHLVTKWTSPSFSSRAAPATCTMYGYVTDITGAPVNKSVILFETLATSPVLGDAAIARRSVRRVTDQSGYFSVKLLQGATVAVSVSDLGLRRVITVPAGEDAVLAVNIFRLADEAPDQFSVQTLTPATLPHR